MRCPQSIDGLVAFRRSDRVGSAILMSANLKVPLANRLPRRSD